MNFMFKKAREKKFIDCGVSVSEILQCFGITSQTLYVKNKE